MKLNRSVSIGKFSVLLTMSFVLISTAAFASPKDEKKWFGFGKASNSQNNDQSYRSLEESQSSFTRNDAEASASQPNIQSLSDSPVQTQVSVPTSIPVVVPYELPSYLKDVAVVDLTKNVSEDSPRIKLIQKKDIQLFPLLSSLSENCKFINLYKLNSSFFESKRQRILTSHSKKTAKNREYTISKAESNCGRIGHVYIKIDLVLESGYGSKYLSGIGCMKQAYTLEEFSLGEFSKELSPFFDVRVENLPAQWPLNPEYLSENES